MIKLGVRLIVSLSSRFDSVKSEEELNVNLRIAWRSTYPTGTLTQRCLIRRKSRREMSEWTVSNDDENRDPNFKYLAWKTR